MDVKFFGEGELPEFIEEIVSDSIEISIASAFLNFQGLSLLKKYLDKYKSIKSLQVLLDEDFHPDNQIKKRLVSELSDLPNTQVRLFCDEKKLFHAKIYCFKGADKVKVVVGSSNFTAGGLFHNVEMNALFITGHGDPEIQRLYTMYKKYWEVSTPAKDYIRKLGGIMGNENFKLGDKVTIGNKPDLGIGKIVGIEDNQVDIYFKGSSPCRVHEIMPITL